MRVTRYYGSVALAALAAATCFAPAQTPPSVYASPETCAGCHRNIWETYRRTGMARAFFRPSPANTIEDYTRHNTYYHKASDSYFTMLRRDGKYYQQRYQMDSGGRRINVMEKQVDYVLGSGNHVRSYLHRSAGNKLIELPLAWYAEKGGYWAMNPGFDRPDHDGFRRSLSYDCMFCHNGYPQLSAGMPAPYGEFVYPAAMPEGIDCQRCHGPGRRHAELAKSGAAVPTVRNAIVNPARLSPERSLEVCLQCHLETTSFPLPNSIRRYERGPFSYKPGESLGDFMLSFDHARGTGHDDKFEIAHSAYRLRQSACFLRSQGRMTCTTCHNPHDIPRGEAAAQHYNAVCRRCHSAAFDRATASGMHPRATGCIDCHMPKRRTEDVVHVVMTDHYIQRRKPAGDLLAELPERHETDATAYRGEVVLYYPEKSARPNDDLYLALAQVIEKSNLGAGIPRLAAAIEREAPQRPEYYLEMADALRNSGQIEKAIPVYREAVRRAPDSYVTLQKLGAALRRSGRYREAEESLRRALSLAPDSAMTHHELGLTYRALGRNRDAVAALETAARLDPDLSEAFNNLGILRLAGADPVHAEADFREAIRIQPDYADAHGNLGNLLSRESNPREAQDHFETALRLRPKDAMTRYHYALLLGRTQQVDRAQRELETALQADPALVEAHLLLGDLLMSKGQAQTALPHYREAARLQPESGRAQWGLGAALASTGDVAGAIPHLQRAAAGPDPAARQAATDALRQLGR